MSEFRFGVFAKALRSGKAWGEFARHVEALGYSTLSVPDHLDRPLAPFPALAAAAQATDRLRVGTLVLNTDLRNPVLLAHEAMTLDVLSDGRFEFGVGCGWKRSDYATTGIRYERGSVRVDRFEETLEVLHPIPLLIGAGGSRMLTLAARHAQIVSITRSSRAGSSLADLARDATMASVESKVACVLETAGDRRPELHIFVINHHTPETARRFAEENGISVADTVDTPQHLTGGRDEMIEQLLARRERLGVAYITIREEYVDEFAAVVEHLA